MVICPSAMGESRRISRFRRPLNDKTSIRGLALNRALHVCTAKHMTFGDFGTSHAMSLAGRFTTISPTRGHAMNMDQIKGNWMQLKGKVKEEWGKLTEDDLQVAEGQVDQLAGKIAVRYGIAKDEAYKRLKKLEGDCDC